MHQVSMNVEVDIDLEELVESLGASGKAHLLSLLRDSTSERSACGRSFDQVIDAAHAAVRAMPNPPREFSDLLWIVHNRATP